MSSSSIGLSEKLQDYLLSNSLDEPEACLALRQETAKLPEAEMISSPEQVQLLVMLAKMVGAKRGLEIGTFTGYSTLRLTLSMPNLRMTCCDYSDTFTSIGKTYWQQSGVDERIDLRLAPAQETLDELLENSAEDAYDFAYIDADKTGYQGYVETCLKLVRSGGWIAIDNVLWKGAVIDSSDQSEDTVALRKFNQWLFESAGDIYDLSLVPIGDGLTLLYLKGS